MGGSLYWIKGGWAGDVRYYVGNRKELLCLWYMSIGYCIQYNTLLYKRCRSNYSAVKEFARPNIPFASLHLWVGPQLHLIRDYISIWAIKRSRQVLKCCYHLSRIRRICLKSPISLTRHWHIQWAEQSRGCCLCCQLNTIYMWVLFMSLASIVESPPKSNKWNALYVKGIGIWDSFFSMYINITLLFSESCLPLQSWANSVILS